jgi:putative nucleotidyltransferase with HDIG domain
VAPEQTKAPWLLDLLAEGDVYEVGGAVRDRLMSEARGKKPPSKDTDYLVRRVPIDRLQTLLRRHGAVNLVGRSFGVIKFTPDVPEGESPVTYDIALPRAEKSTGVGHTDFAVDFDPDLPIESDLGRRDFTINAIAEDLHSGNIVDPFHGRDDLTRHLLRMVFPRAFIEDPLRILRGIQFAARFGLEIDTLTLEAMREAAYLVATVSAERIAEELNKLLLLAEKPSVGFKLMQHLGVLAIILPELEATVGVEQPGGFHTWNVFEHTLYTVDAAPPRLLVRWACLLHDINKPQCRVVDGDRATFYGHDKMSSKSARQMLQRLRYPNDFIEAVSILVDKHMFTTGVTDKGVRRLIRVVSPELIYELLDLRRADVVAQGKGGRTDDVDLLQARITDEINKKSPFGLRDLAINGSDLMTEFGIPPGPRIGQVLNQLLEAVLDDPARNTRSELLSIARNTLAIK